MLRSRSIFSLYFLAASFSLDVWRIKRTAESVPAVRRVRLASQPRSARALGGSRPRRYHPGFQGIKGATPRDSCISRDSGKWKILPTNMSEGSILDTKRPEGP